MVTGSLHIKKNIYFAVLSFKKNGKWTTKWFSTKVKAIRGNKKEAESKLKEILADFEKQLETTEIKIGDKILFIDFMYKWLEIVRHSIEENTYTGYHKLIYGRMTDYFKTNKVTLQDIKPHHIQDFYQYLLGFDLSGNTVTRYHANIRKALQYAVKTDLITYNPADKVEKPKKGDFKASFYTDTEINTLVNLVKGTKIEIPVLLASYYGFRRSEIIGLKWSAIDFVNKTITIEHVVVDVVIDGIRKLVGKDRTKTKASHRTLPLIEDVEKILLELKEKQEENKLLCKNSYNKKYEEYICVDDMGTLINPDYVSHTFTKFLKKNDLRKIRFHDLRHSCASLLLAKGISMKQIQLWLGHSNFNTTANTYTHLDTNGMNESANAIANALSTKKILISA